VLRGAVRQRGGAATNAAEGSRPQDDQGDRTIKMVFKGPFGRGNVLTLDRGGKRQAALRAADIEALRAYWSAQRVGGDVPRRADIDPRRIAPLLPDVFIAERIAPGLARLRVAGLHLSDLMGMEVRGMPVSALIEPGDRDRLADLLVDLFDRPSVLDVELVSAGGLGRAPLRGRLMLLPLRSDLGDISRALGCLVTDEAPGRTPRRFFIRSCRIQEIGDMPPQAAPVGMARQAEGAGAVAQTESKPPRRHSAERPYLRLVTKDDAE
jgi:hypothetical protein